MNRPSAEPGQVQTALPVPMRSNAEIADRLASLAQLLSTQKENPYKIRHTRERRRRSEPCLKASTNSSATMPT